MLGSATPLQLKRCAVMTVYGAILGACAGGVGRGLAVGGYAAVSALAEEGSVTAIFAFMYLFLLGSLHGIAVNCGVGAIVGLISSFVRQRPMTVGMLGGVLGVCASAAAITVHSAALPGNLEPPLIELLPACFGAMVAGATAGLFTSHD